MMKRVIFLIVLAIAFGACDNSEGSKPKQLTAEEIKKEAFDEIMAMEKSLMAFQDGIIDTMKASKLSKLYFTYSLNNLEDSIACEFMFKSGELRMGIGQFIKSIEIFEQLNKSFPSHDKVVETKYLIAFIYHNYLNNLGIAEAKYQDVIDEYPDHTLAQDARVAIKNLTLSDEELIQMFEKKNGI
jgi:tetratricopeptide (TPR) repeat protein